MSLPISRRFAIVAATAAIPVALSLSGCSGSSAAAGKAPADLVIAANATTFTKNFNFLAPTNTSAPPGVDLLYETLIRLSPTNGWAPTGWLADKWEWANNGKRLTFTLGDKATWSDGTPLTSEDVKFTLDLSKKYPQLAQGVTGQIANVEAPNPTTVVIDYAAPAYASFKMFYHVHIFPKHIWDGKDPLTYTNPDPVGSGPFTLARFTPQQVTYALNTHYWHGQGNGVRNVVYKAVSSPDTIMQDLMSGTVDYAESPLVGNPFTDFVAKNPTVNHYWLPEPGADSAMLFNNAVAPTDNVHLRRALAAAIDPTQLIKLEPATSGTPANVTGVNEPAYTDWVAPEYRGKTVQQDPATATSELQASGYQVKDGVLTKDGKSFPLTLMTGAADPWGPALAQQFKQVLGLDVTVAPDADEYTKMQTGKYALAIVGPDVPGQGIPPGVSWNVAAPAKLGDMAGSNWARANSPEAQHLAQEVDATNDVEKQKQLVYQIERIMVDGKFTAPLSPYAWQIAYTTRHWTGWPDPKTPNAIPSNGRGDLITTLLALKPAAS
jgi:peptide/nickel transport system substrate-binding protein